MYLEKIEKSIDAPIVTLDVIPASRGAPVFEDYVFYAEQQRSMDDITGERKYVSLGLALGALHE
jgi:hypothetical protein